ncbi:MAG: hypothetical protein EA376_11095 [Phycisphaeraceae bacterium]|nr:MAG: hypothetical protein EA376_11095 [Phycisphaeraceae bacterium]
MNTKPFLVSLFVLFGVLTLALLAPAGCAMVTHEETRVVETDAVPLGALVVDTRNGSINVSRSDGPGAVITARLKARSQERLEQVEVVAHRRDDGALHVYVEWPDGRARSGEGCSFDISVPDAEGLQLTTSNGSVAARGFRGESRLRTSNGSVSIRDHDGPVSLRTSNGRITAEEVSGPIELRTSNGGVRARLTPDNPGPVNVRSSNGTITLALGAAFEGDLELRTSNGRISLDDVEGMNLRSVSRSEVLLRAGDGDAHSVVRTSNGSITLSQSK